MKFRFKYNLSSRAKSRDLSVSTLMRSFDSGRLRRPSIRMMAGALVFLVSSFWFLVSVNASSILPNIDTQDAGYQWAWADVAGWIDFDHGLGGNATVKVLGDELQGWADSDIGAIVLNCATTPAGDVCDVATGNFKVNNNQGILSGWAWNDNIGWISFRGASYGVTIEPAGDGINSYFYGWAWNDIVGWISFYCENGGVCAIYPTYKIQTDAGSVAANGGLESNVFDTGIASPRYNYIMWQGTPVTGGIVQLQVATSDGAIGPWSFSVPVTVNSGERLLISDVYQGKRYIKYRVLIDSDNWRGNTPVIDDIIINWSP
ncbi:MAG: hypothetical protein ABH822_00320 [Patescibacteria group bacterium]